MLYSLSLGNKKTGAMLTVRSPRSTCPDACSLKNNGCYAENFPLVMHWAQQETKGVEFSTVLYAIKRQPINAIWRLFEAGDFEGDGELINPQQVADLLQANQDKRGFGYTHYPVLPNLALLEQMNNNGLTVNVSANTWEEAVFSYKLGLPVTVVVPEKQPKDSTIDGVRVVVCPAQTSKTGTTCLQCQLCYRAKRDFIIGFRAHGTKKRKIPTVDI